MVVEELQGREQPLPLFSIVLPGSTTMLSMYSETPEEAKKREPTPLVGIAMVVSARRHRHGFAAQTRLRQKRVADERGVGRGCVCSGNRDSVR